MAGLTDFISISNANNDSVPYNFDELLELFPINVTQQEILLTNGFLVLNDKWIEKSSDFYLDIQLSSVGSFVTADVMLHLFHTLIEDQLKKIEKNKLSEDLQDLLWGMYQQTLLDYSNSPNNSNIQEALKRNLVFFGVATKLLELDPEIPNEVNETINSFLRKIVEQNLIEYFPGEDYTQFKVRGYYEGDSTLEKYFRAMKWVSRRIFRVDDDWDSNSTKEAIHELRQSILFSLTLWNDNILKNKWEALYNITSYLVNIADSITPAMLNKAINSCFGSNSRPSDFEADENITLLQIELARPIYPLSKIDSTRQAWPGRIPPKYIQFLGEKYLPDSEVFHNVSYPNTPFRCSNGLEIAATVMGSEKADDLLFEEKKNTPNLTENLIAATTYFDNLPTTYWERSVYNSWLKTLRTLTSYETLSKPTYLPWFTQIEPWQLLRLNSMLASWTQLRHDVILYGKQTFIPECVSEEKGLIEPVSAFWDSLKNMVLAAKRICMNYLNETDRNRFLKQTEIIISLCQNFGAMAKKIEQGETLTDMEQSQIHDIGGSLKSFHMYSENEKSPALIADVLTEPNIRVTLHEATAHFNPILIAYKHGGDYIAGAGLVFSYYEFTTPFGERMTDSEWLELLDQGTTPERPSWTEGFITPKLYEQLTSIPTQSNTRTTTNNAASYFFVFELVIIVLLLRKRSNSKE
ncbi:MAG: DUF3160 domain-containing protein [Promethearchaeota archaeon]